TACSRRFKRRLTLPARSRTWPSQNRGMSLSSAANLNAAPGSLSNDDPLLRMRLKDRVEEARSDVHTVEDMEAEPRRQVDTHVRAADAVAEAIEARRIRTDTELAVDDRHHASRNPALGW